MLPARRGRPGDPIRVTTSGPSSATSRASSVPTQQPQLGGPRRRFGGDPQLAVAQASRAGSARRRRRRRSGPVGEHPRLGQRALPAPVGDVARQHRADAGPGRGRSGPGPVRRSRARAVRVAGRRRAARRPDRRRARASAEPSRRVGEPAAVRRRVAGPSSVLRSAQSAALSTVRRRTGRRRLGPRSSTDRGRFSTVAVDERCDLRLIVGASTRPRRVVLTGHGAPSRRATSKRAPGSCSRHVRRRPRR